MALKTLQEGQAPGHERGAPPPYRARPPVLWAPGGPPPLMPAPTHFIFYPKNRHPAQARVLARFAVIFDLFAQSSIHKTALGHCCLVCDSSIGPISFVLVLYSLQILAALVTLFLSLHVKFMRFQVFLMHDIGSRHL